MTGPENDHQELADAGERQADELEQRSEELQSEVKDARADWERKRSDDSVPGAPAPEGQTSTGEDDDGQGED